VNAGLGNEGDTPYARAVRLFDEAWNQHGFEPDAEFLERYEELYNEAEGLRSRMRALYRRGVSLPADAGRDEPPRPDLSPVAPRPAQQAALHELHERRQRGERKFALVAATGIGKTFLSAFEVRNAGVSRVLFIAHRERIVSHAKQSFAQVLPEMEGLIIQGQASIAQAAGERLSAFATVQTLSRPENLERFAPDAFDYIVIDEFHHAGADTTSSNSRRLSRRIRAPISLQGTCAATNPPRDRGSAWRFAPMSATRGGWPAPSPNAVLRPRKSREKRRMPSARS
jgi:hypothetical protein